MVASLLFKFQSNPIPWIEDLLFDLDTPSIPYFPDMEKAAHQIRYRLAQIDLLKAYQVFLLSVNYKIDSFLHLTEHDFSELIEKLIQQLEHQIRNYPLPVG